MAGLVLYGPIGAPKVAHSEEAGPMNNNNDEELISNIIRGTDASQLGHSERSVQEDNAYMTAADNSHNRQILQNGPVAFNTFRSWLNSDSALGVRSSVRVKWRKGRGFNTQRQHCVPPHPTSKQRPCVTNNFDSQSLMQTPMRRTNMKVLEIMI